MTTDYTPRPLTPPSPARRTALSLGLALTGAASLQALTPAAAQDAKTLTAAGPIIDVTARLGITGDGAINTYKGHRGWTFVPTNGDTIATGTNATDDINALILELEAAGGGTLYFPPGTYVVSGLILTSKVNIVGAGQNATTLLLADGSNRSVIRNRLAGLDGTSENAFGMMIQGLTINGNRWGQRFDWHAKKPHSTHDPHIEMSYGVMLHRLNRYNGQATDSETRIKEVKVEYAYHGGFYSREHSGETRYMDCYAFRNGGCGFTPGWDHILSGNTAGQNEYEGFMLHHGSVTMTGNKSFMSGYTGADGLINGSFYSGRAVPGVRIRGVGHATISGLNVQNNCGPGVTIHDASGVVISGLLADSNNMSATDEGKWYTFDRNHKSHKEQLAAEQAAGSDAEARRAYPSSFSGVEFTGTSHDNVILGASWCSQNQGPGAGDPYGYQAHAVSFGAKTQNNLVIMTNSTGNNRPAGEIINPTQAAGAPNNTVIDASGSVLGRPQAAVDLAGVNEKITALEARTSELSSALETVKKPAALPVIRRAERYGHRDGSLKIDHTSKKVIYYHSGENRWYNVDGSTA